MKFLFFASVLVFSLCQQTQAAQVCVFDEYGTESCSDFTPTYESTEESYSSPSNQTYRIFGAPAAEVDVIQNISQSPISTSKTSDFLMCYIECTYLGKSCEKCFTELEK